MMFLHFTKHSEIHFIVYNNYDTITLIPNTNQKVDDFVYFAVVLNIYTFNIEMNIS
jgi:hypothetical protein